MSDRPNFLFIITDQHRADYLGCAGHPVLRTPQIDSIATRGRRFDRFYVANPICMPNRATLMTGRMPSLHGVRSNGIPLSLQANTFVALLRAHGWRTALLGKSHLQCFTGIAPIVTRPPARPGHRPPPPGFAEATRPIPGDGPYDVEIPQRWRDDPGWAVPLPFYGFDRVDLATNHGDEVGGHYWHWLKAKGGDPDKLVGPDNALPHDAVCPQAWRTAVPEELYPTAYVAERTIDFLEDHARNGGGAPFFAFASFPDPHHPFTPPGRYWDMYRADDMTLPASFAPSNATPPHVAWLQARRDDGTRVVQGQDGIAISEREAREAMALTCGMIAMIDDAVGRILATLDRLGQRDNTVVVFTADHGDFLGDHQLLLKGPIHYQGLIRVPCLWADTPDRARPGTTAALAGTLDLAATILDRAGLEPYNGIQGRSLLAAAAGEDDGPEAVMVEEDGQRTVFGLPGPARLRSVVTRDWRMTLYHGLPWGELYSLRDDPAEMVNRWDDPAAAAVKAEMLERLARLQMATVDRSPLPMMRA